MSFPRYESYKDSGAEWLGEVPSHWKVERLKLSVESCRNGIWGQESDGGPGDIICVRVADFDRVRSEVKLEEPTPRSVSEREREGRLLRIGDLLLEKSGGGENQPVGAVVLYEHPEPAVCSNFVARMRLVPTMHPRFWTYVHSAAYLVRLTGRSINQTSGIQNLDQSAYLEELAPYPPPREQTAIADFLDRETAKIDALVEAQRRLIALLKEKRQAVISHAVTKGLDPSAPMKPSGIDWLGDVPAHWTVTRLKFLGVFGAGAGFPHEEQGIEGEELNFYKVGSLGKSDDDGYLTQSENTISRSVASKLRASIFARDTIVFAKIGAALMLGRLRLLRDDACIDNNMMGFTSHTENDVNFMRYLFETHVRFGAIINPGAVPSLSESEIADTTVAVPSLEEQQAITRVLVERLKALSDLLAGAEKSIALLTERRAALISAAVTGKIDVRGLAAQPAQADAA